MIKNQRESIAIISINPYFERKIFEEGMNYDLRKLPLPISLLHKEIYVYSLEKNAIIGYFKVDCILKGSIDNLFELTDFGKQNSKEEVLKYFNSHYSNYFALCLYDIRNFWLSLTYEDMLKVYSNFKIPNYVRIIYDNNPLYDVIKIWDNDFSVHKNISNSNQMTLQKKKKILKDNYLFFEN